MAACVCPERVEERDVYYWCHWRGGFVKRHSGYSLGPGAVRGISPRGRRKEVGNPSPPTISEGMSRLASLSLTTKGRKPEKRERRLLLSWAKAGKDSEGRSKATRSEGDDLEERERDVYY